MPKISELPALVTAAIDDLLSLVDTGAGATKKISLTNFLASIISGDDGNALELGSDDKLFVPPSGSGPLTWVGRVTQTGENDPVKTEYSNTLGANIGLGRSGVGVFNIVPSVDVFAGKYPTLVAYANNVDGTSQRVLNCYFYTSGVIYFNVFDEDGAPADVFDFLLKIEVFG